MDDTGNMLLSEVNKRSSRSPGGHLRSLPLSSSALTIPEPTVPAPPRANTTLSELDIPAAAARACRRVEKEREEADLCREGRSKML